jgi:hypothetical protein
MKNLLEDQRGVAAIVWIIVALFVVGGSVAVMSYVNNNQADIQQQVDEAEQEQVAQNTGEYPNLWAEANMPEYPNGNVTKSREGRNLEDGVQVTFETSDDIATIKAFYDLEMPNRGFNLPSSPPAASEYASFAIYTRGNTQFTLSITKIGESTNYEVLVKYVEL